MKKTVTKLFTEHPKAVGETYWQHAKCALCIATRLGFASTMAVVHAVFPFIAPPMGTSAREMADYLDSMGPDSRAKTKKAP